MRGAVAETVWDSSTIPLILITFGDVEAADGAF